MNVLVVGHAQIRDSNRNVYRALARLGLGVTLLVPDRWSSAFGKIDVEPRPDVAVELIAGRIAGRHHSNTYWFVDGVARTAAACGAAAIYVDEDPAGFAAWQAARVARRHGLGLVVLAVQNIFKQYPPPFATIQRFVLQTARAAVTNSSDATATLRRRGYSGPFFAKPLTTDARPLDAADRRAVRERYGMRPPTFGYVGRLVTEKGVDVFLDALATLPGAQGLIVGDGPERSQLARHAERLGLANRVRFAGAVSPEEATAVIGALDALVLPSRTMPNWSEQFGRVLVEAMAAGTPLVASASGAIPEVVGDAGILVAEGRADELARGLIRLHDPAVAADFAARGRTRASECYSSRAAALELDRALRHTTRNGAPR
jgi:glycosyltransferase involved in cell wall biosynthesis